MRKIGIGSGAYEENAYFQLAADGFEAVDEDFSNTDCVNERALAEKRRTAESAGIVISQTHGPWRYPPRDSSVEERAERMEKMKKCLYMTGSLGCRYMAIHPIMPFGADMPDDKPLWDRMVDMNRVFFADLIREAERQDVVICFENMPMLHLPLASAADTAAFIREFDSDYFKMFLTRVTVGFWAKNRPKRFAVTRI